MMNEIFFLLHNLCMGQLSKEKVMDLLFGDFPVHNLCFANEEPLPQLVTESKLHIGIER